MINTMSMTEVQPSMPPMMEVPPAMPPAAMPPAMPPAAIVESALVGGMVHPMARQFEQPSCTTTTTTSNGLASDAFASGFGAQPPGDGFPSFGGMGGGSTAIDESFPAFGATAASSASWEPMPPPPPSAPPHLTPLNFAPVNVQKLVEMGFSQAAAERALSACDGDVQQAATLLMDGGAQTPGGAPPPAPSAAPAPLAAPTDAFSSLDTPTREAAFSDAFQP